MSSLHIPRDCRVLVAHSADHAFSMTVHRDGRVEYQHAAAAANTVHSIVFAMHHAQALRLASLYSALPSRVIVSRPHMHVHFTGNCDRLGGDHAELLLLTEELLELGARMMYACNAAAREYARVHKFR